jgi:hypothetical protein
VAAVHLCQGLGDEERSQAIEGDLLKAADENAKEIAEADAVAQKCIWWILSSLSS